MGSNHMSEQFNDSKRKEKKTKASKEDVIYSFDKKNEIPMYDPQTGEPNHDYETLTGKPNPLIYKRTHYTDKIFKTTSNSSYLPPRDFQIKQKNRFLVNLPESFNIQPWFIRSISSPKFKNKEYTFLGFKFASSKTIEPTKIQINDNVTSNVNQKLMMVFNTMSRFDFELEVIDPAGVLLEKWKYIDCIIEEINFGDFSYSDSDLLTINMVIQANDIILLS